MSTYPIRASSFQAFFDNITDADGKISADLKLERDECSAPHCRVRADRPTCSNTYFENLPNGYEGRRRRRYASKAV